MSIIPHTLHTKRAWTLNGCPHCWKLQWNDEFDACEPDNLPSSSRWWFETGFKRNGEDQYYGPDNARCVDGVLRIEARKLGRPLPNPTHMDSSNSSMPTKCQDQSDAPDWCAHFFREHIEYTSSSLRTVAGVPLTFGQYDARIKIPTLSGAWPAWWFLGVMEPELGWPQAGEIDAMEYYKGYLLTNVGYALEDQQPGDIRWLSKKMFQDADFGDHWHVFSWVWTEEMLGFYVDGNSLQSPFESRPMMPCSLSHTVDALQHCTAPSPPHVWPWPSM